MLIGFYCGREAILVFYGKSIKKEPIFLSFLGVEKLSRRKKKILMPPIKGQLVEESSITFLTLKSILPSIGYNIIPSNS